MFLVFLLLSCSLTKHVFGANILFVNMVASPSHQIWTEFLVEGLLEKGHNLTLIAPSEGMIRSKNYTVLKFPESDAAFKKTKMSDFIHGESSSLYNLAFYWRYHTIFADVYLNSDAVKILLAYPRDVFDMIVLNINCGYYFYPLIEYFGNPPVIATSPFSLAPQVIDAMGSEFYSYFPLQLMPYTDQMNFFQRLNNLAMRVVDICLKTKYVNIMRDLTKKRFGEEIISFERVERGFQLLLANYDPILDFPVPLPPYIIPAGGLQNHKPSALPEDLGRILNDSRDGVVYFSLGTNMEPSLLTPDKKRIFLNVFSKLKQVVLWKYDGDDLKNEANNIVVRKWYPQNGILGHKNLKLFITHAGGLSTREMMYHGVPTVALPLFLDQRSNAANVHERNLGRRLFMDELTEDDLYETIQEVLNNPIYKENIQRVSRLFRDQKETPLERAVFWMEYTLRHKNLSHLWTRSRDMNIYERHDLDLFGFIFVCLSLLVLSVLTFLKWIFLSYIHRRKIKIKIN